MTDYILVMASEDEYSRSELRETEEQFEAVYMRPQVGGGWYVEERITVQKQQDIDQWRQVLINASDRMFAEMMNAEGDSFTFRIDRKDQPGDDDQTTFSADAVDGIRDSIMLWFGTRVMRFYDQHRRAPKHAEITITVRLQS